MFADPLLEAREAQKLARSAVRRLKDLPSYTDEVTASDVAHSLGIISDTESEQLEEGIDSEAQRYYRRIGGNVEFKTFSTERVVTRSHKRVRVWLINDLAWLYPDDATLWRILIRCERQSEPLLVVARKIAPATFHLFKMLGVRGLQYYSLLCRSEPSEIITSAVDRVGLPHLASLQRIRTHAVRSHLASSVNHLVTPLDRKLLAKRSRALSDASEMGFDRNNQPTPRLLLEWSERTEEEWPAIWHESLNAWHANQSTPINIGANEPLTHSEGAAANSESGDVSWELAPIHANERLLGTDPSGFSRSRIAAEVDRETWDRLLERRNSKRNTD